LGMSEDRLATLSHPFALGDATFTREGVGPGLGISIARAIAELSGGRIAIDSSLSLGTTVAISLPLQVASQTMQAAE
jgi:two-component system cell cycle sensor histidine kinase PleC